MLSGNGTMGAMVNGQPCEETIILSHAALYLPQKRSGKIFNQQARLKEIKTLLLTGDYKKAAALPAQLRKDQGYNDERDPFIPAFDLHISQQSHNIKKYQRSVNFEIGEAIVKWIDDEAEYMRKVFVSRADSLVVLSLKSNGKINCSLNFEQHPVPWDQAAFVKSGVKVMSSVVDSNYLIFKSKFNYIYPGGLTGYTGVGRLVQTNGTHYIENGKLVISGADEVVLLIKISPATADVSTLAASLRRDLSAFKPGLSLAKMCFMMYF